MKKHKLILLTLTLLGSLTTLAGGLPVALAGPSVKMPEITDCKLSGSNTQKTKILNFFEIANLGKDQISKGSLGHQRCKASHLQNGGTIKYAEKYCPKDASIGYAIAFEGHREYITPDTNKKGTGQWAYKNIKHDVSVGFGRAFKAHRSHGRLGSWGVKNIDAYLSADDGECFTTYIKQGFKGEDALKKCNL